MTFAAPFALAGLLFAAIPIILHLLARREPPTIVFPATRYLADATRLHQRRLRLEHFLLLLLRTLLIVALVLAAAGPSLPTAGLGTHAPTAAVIVLDNSLSSGAIVGGVPVLDRLKETARSVLARATGDDRLWLLDADGVPRIGTPASLGSRIDTLEASGRRIELGSAVALAAEILGAVDGPGEIIVISDLQRTALAGAAHGGPMTVLRPAVPVQLNAGLNGLALGSQPWGPDGGTAVVAVGGSGDGARPVTLSMPGRPPRQILVPPGGQSSQKISGVGSGWWTITAALDPDELRADDARSATLRVAPPARASWGATDRFLATAADVLAQNGRIVAGSEVTLGSLGAGAAIVTPPLDPAQVGAVNRALAARGSPWRFGDLTITPGVTDSGPWLGRERISRRHRLQFQGGAPSDILVTVAGEPWVARSGRLVLVGSRFDPDWTALPLSAGFVPFIDGLVNRAARGEFTSLSAAPGDRLTLPDRVTEVATADRRWPVEGGAGFVPPASGAYFLLVARDTIGALDVNPDPRESDLARAEDEEVRSLWPGARIGGLDRAEDMAFQAGARSDLRGPLLWAALILGLLEAGLASWRKRAKA